jgi:MFS family permease
MGPAALGIIEGIADLLMSAAKLGSGFAGHYLKEKRRWAALGYLTTVIGTTTIGLTQSFGGLALLRAAAWVGRGFRSPLRDYVLADAVEPSHFGRAYGIERASDMLGAVVGPLVAALLVWAGLQFRSVILWGFVPGLLAVAAIFFLTQEKGTNITPSSATTSTRQFPKLFWAFLVGVTLFGLGDFSCTFLIFLAAQGLGEKSLGGTSSISIAMLLYTCHNLVSALAAYPAGRFGDKSSKMKVLIFGYGIGAVTNILLALYTRSFALLVIAIALSGVYFAIEETLEKAVAAELLPREYRSLGFGYLATCNAIGDMVSSLYIGFLLQANKPILGFGIAAMFGSLGTLWLLIVLNKKDINLSPETQQ